MTTWAVRNDQDRANLIRLLEKRKLPFTANLTQGAPRSLEQNRLQRKWLLEAEEQGDMTAEEYRGYCKLHFGVPILRSESDAFQDVYDRIIRPLSYEQKLELMMLPIDLPVTRLMSTKQKTKYLDMMYHFFLEQGFQLTEPER